MDATTSPRASRRPIVWQQSTSSYRVWLALMAYLVLVKLVITAVPTVFRHEAQAAVFDWLALSIWTVAGLAGIFFARKTGFPDAFDECVTHWQRFGRPALLGLGFSAVFVAIDATTHYNQLLAAHYNQPQANIDFPASLLIYSGGAIIVEVLYRLLLVPLLLWLLSNVALKGRGQEPIFWALALLTSLIEPLSQRVEFLPVGVAAAVFASAFGVNLAQAAVFRRYGLLAAITLRVAFYLVWHILYVH